MRRIPVRLILKWTAYPLFFLMCFVFFAYKTFPYERLADLLTREAQSRGYDLEIADLTHSGLTGLSFDNVRLVFPSDDEASPPAEITFEALTVSTSLFSLMSDNKSYSFDAELGGGEAYGDILLGADLLDVDVEIEDINLETLPGIRTFSKVPLAGTLNGEIVLVMPSEVEDSTGNVAITIEALNVGDGESQVEIPGWGGLTLDRADLGNLDLVATIEDGEARIERATAHGKDLELDVLGRVRLLRPLKKSELNLMLRVKIQDAYKERSAKVATMLELASAGLKAALTTDGAIQYMIGGSPGGQLRPRSAGRLPFEAPK
ncbi:MAG: type II secretion system protein GspN [Polyangiales bacterium]